MSKSGFSCCGGKECCGGGTDSSDGLHRRDFLKAAAVGGVGAAALLSVEQANAAAQAVAFDQWNASLLERGETRIYRGDDLKHIAMPLGGIGAGQVYLRGDGTLNPWQNFNNFNSNAIVPDSFFAVRTKDSRGAVQARLLQLGDRENAKGVQAIEYSGEYPFAWIRYNDDAIPVRVGLEAFSPYIPLNTKDSGLPAVLFRFTIHNDTDAPVDTAVLVAIPNLVGWDGYSRPEPGPADSEFGGNRNEMLRAGGATLLDMTVSEGNTHELSVPINLRTNDGDVARHMRHCTNVKVYYGRPLPARKESTEGDVYWVSDINGRLSANELSALLDVVEAGATAIVTCDEFSLIHDALNPKKAAAKADIFENFETGSYANWKIEGDAFGDAPATGTFPGQQKVSGWQGTYYLNSWANGDGPVGKATSREFTIEKRFIHFLVGGGAHANETCINLVVDGKTVATEVGQNTEQLRPVRWDASEHLGKKAVIEIVDTNTGGWGHILIDDIQFSDAPRLSLTDPVLAERLRNALPFTARGTKAYDFKTRAKSAEQKELGEIESPPRWTVRGFKLKDGAKIITRDERGAPPRMIAGPCGNGRLVITNGAMHDEAQGNTKKLLIGVVLANAIEGARYKPQNGIAADSPLAGSMALAVLPERGVVTQALPQAQSFREILDQFAEGVLKATTGGPSPEGRSWTGALSAHVSLAAKEERTVTFVLAWHFPNRTRDLAYGWGPERYQYDHRLGNQYNNWFKSAKEVVAYVSDNHARLVEETRRFHTTFYNSTLPQYYLDAVIANASLTRSPIYVWLEDGTVGGFEGADRCCPMNCTHVYNYAMTTAYTFPALERNVRETDLLVQMHPEEHYIPHRTVLPLSLPRLGKNIGGPEHPALDGELGTVLKTYREWQMHGDRAWLSKVWDRVRLLMLYIMKEHDTDGDGVIKGEQPNTYDTHLFGSNTFIGTLYLAALRAAEEMANVMGDKDSAKTFRDRFEKGRAGYDATCWDGEYYKNVFDAPSADDKTYNSNNCYGPGCFSDQLLGQWWAHVLGLGYVLPEERVRQALYAIYKHNWRADLTDHKHNQRVFAAGTEKGLLVGSWPKGGRPERPILYCDEVWTGIEYHVAATMLYEGMVNEALQIVRGARDRYTGSQRNPWSEIECGQHYARAMSSYSLMHAAAGLVYDAGAARISMAPRLMQHNFKAFFTAANGWGSLSQLRNNKLQRNSVEVRYGTVELKEFVVETSHTTSRPQVAFEAGREKARGTATFTGGACRIALHKPIVLESGDSMNVVLSW
ncbi:MAG: twin-arginine translocation signal domain-containing protein [Candidatus Hydrogenedentes bacterium]|nr:twin-arginine translocation signal domain-containing protein [Candidatus Hydrogenedentota bacterium]